MAGANVWTAVFSSFDTATAGEMQQPSYWSFCNESSLDRALSMLRNSRRLEQYETPQDVRFSEAEWIGIQASIAKARSHKDPFLKVSSELWDIARQRTSRVAGVGSFLALLPDKKIHPRDSLKLRFFVLTAGHVAKGDGLRVTYANGDTLGILSVTHDLQNDLSLIELDANALQGAPMPFGFYARNKNVAGVFTHFSLSGDNSASSRFVENVLPETRRDLRSKPYVFLRNWESLISYRAVAVETLNQIDGVRLSMAAIRSINPAAKLIQTDDLGRTYGTANLRGQAAFDNMRLQTDGN
ncbi:MAG: hypothetical protein EOP06_30440, partial [Proteobacteria bacterium]